MRTARAARWIDEVIVNGALFQGVLAVERARPRWIPAMNRALARVYLDRPARVGASTLMLTTPMPVRHRETEGAVPMTRAAEAFDRIVRMLSRDQLAVNVPLELRFVRGDDAWMSPAEGADTCQLGAYAGGVPDVDRYFAGFWRELRALGARPHWGKELDHEAAELATLFPGMARFQALRDRLDPARIFAGPFHQRILGP
jgi:FAD/FMN-containing dehydrogenase